VRGEDHRPVASLILYIYKKRKQNIKQNKIGHYEVRVTQSVVFFVVFCITLFVLAGFGHGIV
jgi:hypothetical protein